MARYPKPMFDFATQREICIRGMKTAYAAGLHGNDPKVMDGNWKQAFDDAGEGPTEGKEGGPGGLVTWDDAEGDEESEEHAPPRGVEREARGAAGRKARGSAASPAKAKASPRGHKREASQGTLEGTFGKGGERSKAKRK